MTKRPEKITSVGKKLAIAASFAVPAMLGICICVARKFDFLDFCDLFVATSLVRATRTGRSEENEDESSGESTKSVTEGSSGSNVDKSGRKSSNVDKSGRKSSNVDESGRKSIQSTDSASGQK